MRTVFGSPRRQWRCRMTWPRKLPDGCGFFPRHRRSSATHERYSSTKALIVLLLIAAGLPTEAAAQQGWTGSVIDLSHSFAAGPATGFGAIAADAAGNVRVLWTQESDAGLTTGVRTTQRDRETGTWSEPTEIFRTSDPYGVVCGQLVMDDRGNAVASCHTDAVDEVVTLVVLRYTTAEDTWSAEELERGVGLIQPYLAMDAAGNAYAVWSSTTLRLRRLDASTNQWGPPAALPFVGLEPRVVADADGSLFVTWRVLAGANAIMGAHYVAAIARWSAASAIFVWEHSIGAVDLAYDRTGHVMVVWGQWTSAGGHSAIRASRYSPSVGWGPVIDVATYPGEFSEPRIVADEQGNALAAWYVWRGPSRGRIEAATYAVATSTWGTPTPLSPESEAVSWPVVTTDGRGNATIAWLQIIGGLSGVRVVRFAASAGTFGPMTTVASAYPYRPLVWMAADPSGAATVVWQTADAAGIIVQATRWEPTPVAPVITHVAVEPGVLRVHLAPGRDKEPGFLAVTYEYSVDDGQSWSPRIPPSATSPLDIRGMPGGSSALRVRAVNHAGAGVASALYSVTLSPAPDPPMNFAALGIVENRVTVGWIAPAGSTLAEGYVLEGGSAPGEVLARITTGGTAPIFTFAAPRGTFYLRLRAFSGASFSPPSNEVQIIVDLPVAPSAPANLLGLVNGMTTVLSWTNTTAGGTPTSLRLDVSGSWTGTLPLPLSEAFSFPSVPAGTYTMTLRAVNAAGVSPPSNAVTLTVPNPCSGSPASPRNLATGVDGGVIHLKWDAPVSGDAVMGYEVIVTGTFNGSVRTSARSLSSVAAPGSYTVSVIAINSCGASAPTTSQTVAVQ
jgi:hypothetical protein